MSFVDRTLTRPLFSELYYTTPKIFRLGLQFAAGTMGPDNGPEVYNAVIHDSNFPCNDADLGSLKAWAHN
uniref:Catalase n=1 Tax=Panagrolaimus sp. JU765 TaxID=591449 RepID=A0AC34QCH5_9BILA